MPSLCEACGRYLCDHTREERGLNDEEWEQAMNREFTPEELAAWETNDPIAKLAAARHAHEQFTKRPFPTEPIKG